MSSIHLSFPKALAWVLISLALISSAKSQGLAAFTDFQQKFHIFDHGQIKVVEEQKVKSFKVGGTCIAYIDFADNFKIYHNGEVKTVEIGGVQDYAVTDYLVAYRMTNILKVFDNGNVKTLTASSKDFIVGDSLVVFYDGYYNSINGYYRGKIYSQRLRLIGKTINKLSAASNIAALITAEDRNFWIFYKGESHLINEFVEDVNFKTGQDIVAYMDEPTRTFKVFYQGAIYDVENFKPKSYWMGDGRVAYIDDVGNFKVFQEGQIVTISSNEPDFYLVNDSMIIFRELDRFKCFFNNRIYEIEPYIPEKYEFQRHYVAYLDNSGNIKLFDEGRSEILNYGGQVMVNSFELISDVIVINAGVNDTKIYYRGKIYE